MSDTSTRRSHATGPLALGLFLFLGLVALGALAAAWGWFGRGGGTSLATQRECLELMGCYGKGKAYKLLEIAAGMVVAGELSLVSAARTDKETGTNEWVDAHEKLGRNR